MASIDAPLLMIIDDEFGVRESLKIVFSKDFRLLEADSMEAALPKVAEAKPNVILLDMLMPRTDGLVVLQKIKGLHDACEVIILTGVNSQQLADKARDFGASDFVGKPFDVVDLRQKVARAFERIAQRAATPTPSN
jgi:two-component system response regulator (stage 0 sporulation protein F)